jgi:hypothetical protein
VIAAAFVIAVALSVVATVRAINDSTALGRSLQEVPAVDNPTPPSDRISRVITHYDAIIPQFCVCVQMADGRLVHYGRWCDPTRAQFERLALERMLFEGRTTKPPVSFDVG